MNKLEIETQLDFPQYLKLTYTLTYRKPIMIILTLVGLFVFFIGIRYMIVFDDLKDAPYKMLAFGAFMVILLPLGVYWSTKRNFGTHARLKEKIIYSFDKDQIHVLGESFNSSMTWDKIFKVLELNDWMLIYHNKLVANLIPKSSFSDEEYQRFRQILSEQPGLKTKLKKMKNKEIPSRRS